MPILLLIAVILSALLPTSQLRTQGISLYILNPTQGASIYGNTIIVRLYIPGLTIRPRTIEDVVNRTGQGHLVMMLDLRPAVAWDRTDPYVLQDVPAGDHLLSVEVVQNDETPFNPPVVKQILFTAVATEAPSLTLPPIFGHADTAVSSTPTSLDMFAGIGSLFVLTGGGIGQRLRAESKAPTR